MSNHPMSPIVKRNRYESFPFLHKSEILAERMCRSLVGRWQTTEKLAIKKEFVILRTITLFFIIITIGSQSRSESKSIPLQTILEIL